MRGSNGKDQIAHSSQKFSAHHLFSSASSRPKLILASTSTYSAAETASCDRILQQVDSEDEASRLDSVIVSSEHDLENLEKHLN